jgi:hypothetical protein
MTMENPLLTTFNFQVNVALNVAKQTLDNLYLIVQNKAHLINRQIDS